MKKSHSARVGHVKRALLAKQPLTGKVLEFALQILGKPNGDATLDGIRQKIEDGQPLNDYQLHVMVDVVLLYARLYPPLHHAVMGEH